MGSVTLASGLASIIGNNEEVRAEVVKAGEKILAVAKSIVPVDTGATLESGHVELDTDGHNLIAHVIFDTDYAMFLEFGTSDTPTFAMLRRGAEGAGYKLREGR